MSRVNKRHIRKGKLNRRAFVQDSTVIPPYVNKPAFFTGDYDNVSANTIANLNHHASNLIKQNQSVTHQVVVEWLTHIANNSQCNNERLFEKIHAWLFIQCVQRSTGAKLPLASDMPKLVDLTDHIGLSLYWDLCNTMSWGSHIVTCLSRVPEVEQRLIVATILQPSVMRQKVLVESVLASVCEDHVMRGCGEHASLIVNVVECISKMFVFPVYSVDQCDNIKLKYSPARPHTVITTLTSVHALLSFCHLHLLNMSTTQSTDSAAIKQIQCLFSTLPSKFITSVQVTDIVQDCSGSNSDVTSRLCQLLPDLQQLVTLLRYMWTTFLSIQHGVAKQARYYTLHTNLLVEVTALSGLVKDPYKYSLLDLPTIVEDIQAFVGSASLDATLSTDDVHVTVGGKYNMEEKIFRIQHNLVGSDKCLELLVSDGECVMKCREVCDIIKHRLDVAVDISIFKQLVGSLIPQQSSSSSLATYIDMTRIVCEKFASVSPGDQCDVITTLVTSGHSVFNPDGKPRTWLVLADYDFKFQQELSNMTESLIYMMLPSPAGLFVRVLERGLVSDIYGVFASNLVLKYKRLLTLHVGGDVGTGRAGNLLEMCLYNAITDMDIDDDNLDNTLDSMLKLLRHIVDSELTDSSTCISLIIDNICSMLQVNDAKENMIIIKHILLMKCVRSLIDKSELDKPVTLSHLTGNMVQIYKYYFNGSLGNIHQQVIRELVWKMCQVLKELHLKKSDSHTILQPIHYDILNPFDLLLKSLMFCSSQDQDLVVEISQQNSTPNLWCQILITGAINKNVKIVTRCQSTLCAKFDLLVTALTFVLPRLIKQEWINLLNNMLYWLKSNTVECQCRLSDYAKLIGLMPSVTSLPYITLVSLLTTTTHILMQSKMSIDKHAYFSYLLHSFQTITVSNQLDNDCKFSVFAYFVEIYPYHRTCSIDICKGLLGSTSSSKSLSLYESNALRVIINKWVTVDKDKEFLMCVIT